jgi:hypothetical protein
MGLFTPDPEMLAQSYEMINRHLGQQDTIISLLEQAAAEDGPGLQTLAVTEDEVPGGIEVDFPVLGARRWLIPRLATGGSFAVPSSLVTLLPSNNRRLGGTIVNRGEADCKLFLASPARAASQAGLGEIFLTAHGGSWDFRVGSLLWCGSICAIAVPTLVGEVLKEATIASVVEV